MRGEEAVFNFLNGLSGQNSIVDFLIVFFARYLFHTMIIALAVWFGYSYFKEKNKKNRLAVKKTLLLIACAVIIAILLEWIIQQFYFRPRPFVLYNMTPLIAHAATISFPSTHALLSFTLASSIMAVKRKIGILLLVLAALISLSRVIAGLHFFSDILGGAILGVLSAMIARYIFLRFIDKRST